MDTLTNQIVEQLGALPIGKKKALLELLKQEHSPVTSQFMADKESWKKQLLSTSVWTEDEINALHEAGEFINQNPLERKTS